MDEVQQVDLVDGDLAAFEVGVFPMDGAVPDCLPIRVALWDDEGGRTDDHCFTVDDAEKMITALRAGIAEVQTVWHRWPL